VTDINDAAPASRVQDANTDRSANPACRYCRSPLRPAGSDQHYPDGCPAGDRRAEQRRVGQVAAGVPALGVARCRPGAEPSFGEPERALRVRVATGLLYGDTDAQRETALTASDPLTLLWISATLTRIEEILADLAPPSRRTGNPISAGQI
jgi:aspartate aminotransferase